LITYLTVSIDRPVVSAISLAIACTVPPFVLRRFTAHCRIASLSCSLSRVNLVAYAIVAGYRFRIHRRASSVTRHCPFTFLAGSQPRRIQRRTVLVEMLSSFATSSMVFMSFAFVFILGVR